VSASYCAGFPVHRSLLEAKEFQSQMREHASMTGLCCLSYDAYYAGDYEAAVKLAARASEQRPSERAWRLRLAHALHAAGRLAEATGAYRAYLSSEARNWTAKRTLRRYFGYRVVPEAHSLSSEVIAKARKSGLQKVAIPI